MAQSVVGPLLPILAWSSFEAATHGASPALNAAIVSRFLNTLLSFMPKIFSSDSSAFVTCPR